MTNGEKTSEYKLTVSASAWGIAFAILGVITTSGSAVAASIGEENAQWGIIAGAIVSVAGILLKALTSLGYNKGRVEAKMKTNK